MSKVKRREAHKNTPPKKQANYRNQQTFLTDISQHQWSKFQNKKTIRKDAKVGSILLLNLKNKPFRQG